MRQVPHLIAGLSALALEIHGADRPQRPLEVADLRATPPIEGTAISGITWMPHSGKLAFLARREDKTTDLFVEDPRSGARERLVDGKNLLVPDAKNPVSLAGYQWAPDGNALLLASDEALLLYDLKSRTLAVLTRGPSEFPSFAPDGRSVAFVRRGNLHVLDLTTRRESELTKDGTEHIFNGRLDWVYEEELSNHGGKAYEWSPDSHAIALIRLDENKVPSYPLIDFLSIPHASFSEQRYPNPGDTNSLPSIRVVNLEGHERARVDFATTEDLYVVPELSWLPDSRGVVYQTLNRDQTILQARLLSFDREEKPILAEEHDPFWINVPDRITSLKRGGSLHFLKDGRFLWLSERSGFNHLYLGSLGDRSLKPVTRGDWAVDSVVGVDEDSGTAYFTSTEGDPRERQIFRIRLDGSEKTRLTTESGVHGGELSPDGGYILENFSSLRTPPTSRLLSTRGQAPRTLDAPANRFSEFAFPTTEFVDLKAEDGSRLCAKLTKPPDFDPGKRYPVIVYVYGGPHAQLVRNEFPRLSAMHVLASHGYLVWSLDNRGSWGRGHRFESPIFKDMGKVELTDQLEGVRYLRSLPYVDAARIGITGWSYGGYMTLYAMTHAPEVWKCGAAGAPVTDWKLYDSIYTERYMRTPRENPEGYGTSSPLLSVSKIKSPLLLVHGTSDDNVHMYNTINFVSGLIKAGIPYELQIGPGEHHGFRGKATEDARDREIVGFFEKNL